jgi:protein-disulfide isomerase
MTTLQYNGSDRKDPRDGLEHKLVTTEFADPQCPLCMHIIQEINEIFEHDDTSCQDPKEYCMTSLLETVHTSLIWRLSKL